MTKSSITLDIDAETKRILEKRAKRELLTLRELASDILRRSALSSKQSAGVDKTDDSFLTYFSRKTRKK
ncbi:MAG TPA: hypothetical protein VJK51_04540 [Candidatus Nanoarchaeia archaeon]|nr:hypothetical protein [Candidatus Nanoarchaeia archaeon]